MSELSNNARNLAKPIRLTLDGKAWSFSRLTDETKAELETTIIDRQRGAAIAWKDMLPHDDYMELLIKVNDEIGRNKYVFMSPWWQRYIVDPDFGDGGRVLLTGLLRPNHPDLTEEDVTRLILRFKEELKGIIKEIMAEFAQKKGYSKPTSTPAPPKEARPVEAACPATP